MPDEPPKFRTLSRTDLTFTLMRVFAKRRGRTRHQQALLDATATQVVAEIVADALIAEGYEVRHAVAPDCGWTAPGDTGRAIEHPAD